MIDLAKQKMFHIGFGFWLIEKDTALFSLVLCGSVWLEWVRQVWINFIGDQRPKTVLGPFHPLSKKKQQGCFAVSCSVRKRYAWGLFTSKRTRKVTHNDIHMYI
jgi:hypothetical protein